ncbi:hypothetical protein AB0M87_21015 [Streptomyces sp. NPDC051320]|uniref:hypothetical protein n=1 Tax=Streptomyces sp. NPDC051320 TaxID=3154644 RepID=UPI00342AD605
MIGPAAHLVVNVAASPIAAWFHHLFTRPVVEIDGSEHAARWGTTEIPLVSGGHRLNVYFRYRWQNNTRLAESSSDFAVGNGSRRVSVDVQLGSRNGSCFRIEAPVSD